MMYYLNLVSYKITQPKHKNHTNAKISASATNSPVKKQWFPKRVINESKYGLTSNDMLEKVFQQFSLALGLLNYIVRLQEKTNAQKYIFYTFKIQQYNGPRMAARRRDFVFVGEDIYDIWYPYAQKITIKSFKPDLVIFR